MAKKVDMPQLKSALLQAISDQLDVIERDGPNAALKGKIGTGTAASDHYSRNDPGDLYSRTNKVADVLAAPGGRDPDL